MHTQWPQPRIRSVRLRPEKPYVELSWLDVLFRQLNRWLLRSWLQLLPGDYWLVRRIIRRSDELTALSEQEFAEHIDSVRQQLTAQGINGETLPEAFAMIREAAGRSLGMRHHHTQIRASVILLRGKVAEMATGEGKTLAGTLASSTAAMAGIGVHVITTNDYLAARDREEMKPLYDLLGLSVESVTNESEIGDRQKAYASDITYCTNNELVFDYLKDSLVLDARKNPAELDRDVLRGNEGLLGKLMHRGLNFAIVDEADSVLIDESRTPLVISGGDVEMEDEEEFLRGIMQIARTLHEGEHFRIDWKNRRIFVKPAGVQAVEADEESGSWLQSVRREQVLNQALTALHLFDRDKHYLVSDDKVVIVDEYTGRTAPDRSWEGGLHQLIEIKEDCPLTRPKTTLAKISYQNFFRKYFHLSGMTGTGEEVRSELLSVYGLYVMKVPLLKRSRRRTRGWRVLAREAAKVQAVAEAAQREVAKGRSVLIGAASVYQSEELAEALEERGVTHRLLSAKQDKEEADVIAGAGRSGQVTIATSMAGRGTDIKLDDACKEAGGLHVIISELHDAARVDRQLAGRCARQGDPGSVEYILSLEDPLIRMFAPSAVRWITYSSLGIPWLISIQGRVLQRYCQMRLERKHARERRMTLKMDEKERATLAFIGGGKWH